MSGLRLVGAVWAALVVAACSIGSPAPRTTTYVIALPPPAAATTRQPYALRMGNVRVAPSFAGSALVYRMDDVQFTPDFYHAFIAEPGPMLGGLMAEWLDRTGSVQDGFPARWRGERAVCPGSGGHGTVRGLSPGAWHRLR